MAHLDVKRCNSRNATWDRKPMEPCGLYSQTRMEI